MNDVISYLIGFLLGEDGPADGPHAVGYTDDPKLFSRYKLVIVPSGFFDEGVYGTAASLPSLPLGEIDGLPFLFGEAREEQADGVTVIYADLIASAYFLLTRYEEMVRREVRDVHGRFPGKESLPYRGGFLHRPLVDEYRALLRRRLLLPPTAEGIRSVFLTHDVDAPFLYRSFKGFIRSLLDGRGIAPSLRGRFGPAEGDPFFTFPYIFGLDGRVAVAGAEVYTVFFFKAGGRAAEDKPHYSLRNRDIRRLIESILERGAVVGLHASYEAGVNPSLIVKERERLERNAGTAVVFNRHHFLNSREPEDMDSLEAAGISDDFTLGYADVAGFRLGTCRPVRRINPLTRRLTSLRLHPLTVMDRTLDDPKYMDLGFNEAVNYCLGLIRETAKAGGELSLLWHNSSLREDDPDSYHRALYSFLTAQLSSR
ncbi:MAG: polysaccharide deacetylase family protein [Tannerellaceae bacterium]|jgi:hypothetical protein|nr:polysaccharide deacetylase family protein [Tannerellaceae bacterium]